MSGPSTHDPFPGPIPRFAPGQLVHHRRYGYRGVVVDFDVRYWDTQGLSFSERPEEQFGSRPTVAVAQEQSLRERGVLAEFHRYVTEGAEPGISARQNLEVMALCEMTVRSCHEQRAVGREELGV